MLNRHAMSRFLLGRRLKAVEELQCQAYQNQQMIWARKAQISSAGTALCQQPTSPFVAFSAGAVAALVSDNVPSATPLVMRILSLARLF